MSISRISKPNAAGMIGLLLGAAVVWLTVSCGDPDASSPVPPTQAVVEGEVEEDIPYWSRLSAETASEELPRLGTRNDYELVNTQEWLNGDATSIKAIRDAGEVVLVDFWTYT